MSNNNEQEDVWVHVGVPVLESGNEEDGVMVEDIVIVTATEHCEDRDDSPGTEPLKEEEITSIGMDLLWLIVVCLMLASTLWSMFLSSPCTSSVGVGVQHHVTNVLTPSKSISTTLALTALSFDDFVAEHDAFLGATPVRNSHLKTAEVTPVVFSFSTSVDIKKDVDNEAHMDGISAATTTAATTSTTEKVKAVTKRANTSIQEITKGVDVNRKVNKKHASHKAHMGERLVAGSTLQKARSVDSALSEHALIPTPAKTLEARGAIPTSQYKSAGGSKETKLAVVQAPLTMPTGEEGPARNSVPSDVNTGGEVPVLQPIKSPESVTGTKKEENADVGAGMSVGAGGHAPAFIKKTPPSFQVATRVLAAVQIPVAVDTSRDIPVVDKAKMKRTMQEAPVIEPGDVVVLMKENFRSFLSSNKFAFVVFHGPDCDDCDKLETEWQAFAHQTKKYQLAVAVGKVDCAQEKSLCDKSMTTTFPSFRWYQNATALYGYYRNYPRTSEKFLAYAKTKIYIATSVKKL